MISTRTGANILLSGQYIKDLSFENPRAPGIYTLGQVSPNIKVAIDINANKLQDEIYEVELIITCEATEKDETVFMVELKHGGVFKITDVEQSLIEETLFVDCAYLLFPFSRRIIADLTTDGNFPPLLLDAVDFDGLYKKKKE